MGKIGYELLTLGDGGMMIRKKDGEEEEEEVQTRQWKWRTWRRCVLLSLFSDTHDMDALLLRRFMRCVYDAMVVLVVRSADEKEKDV